MKFRPCIDIHNGKVKQIVGSSLKDENNEAKANYVSEKSAGYYAKLYSDNNLSGGHIILLNKKGTEYFEDTKKQALQALKSYPEGMQIGGGIDAENAMEYIDAGASHVIVTSYVFSNGHINYENMDKLVDKVGKNRIVLDLSCRVKEDGQYYIVTDRWQKFTNEIVNKEMFDKLSKYCDEFLVHAVDVEGKNSGIDERIIELISKSNINKITYAGGITEFDDIFRLQKLSSGRIDFTIGSALDIFGGELNFDKIVQISRKL